VKKVTTGGTFRFRHWLLYLANAMVDQHIGLEETDDGIWAIHFNVDGIVTIKALGHQPLQRVYSGR